MLFYRTSALINGRTQTHPPMPLPIKSSHLPLCVGHVCSPLTQKYLLRQAEVTQCEQRQRPRAQFGAQVPGQVGAIRRFEDHAHMAAAIVERGDLGFFQQADQPG